MNNSEFWIISSKGTPLFMFSSIKDLEAELISGFFSTVQSFARNFINDNKEKYYSTISIGEFNYYFLCNQLYNIYFILKSTNHSKEKNVYSTLKKFEELFIEEFRMDIITFDGNTSRFEKFSKVINKFLDK